MLKLNDLHFLKLDLEGLQILVSWAEVEGWNPGPHDADVFWKTDLGGFYGYFHENEMIYSKFPEDLFLNPAFLELLGNLRTRAQVSKRWINNFIPRMKVMVEQINSEIER